MVERSMYLSILPAPPRSVVRGRPGLALEQRATSREGRRVMPHFNLESC